VDLDYVIVRSPKRRKLTITVERDRRIVVHAPESVSEAKIREVVDSKRQWIFEKTRHTQKYNDGPEPPGKELVNGEAVLYQGRHYRIAITDTESGDIEFSRQFVVPPGIAASGSEAFANWMLVRAEQKILPRVRLHARQLGVSYRDAEVSEGRFRWGSCTPRNSLRFNWRLIKAPMFVIDYVIIHELVHLIEPNHTPRFWNIVSAQHPAAEKAKDWLREHGALLEQNL
jgi:predicted metal-dependent hydrolase